MVLRPLWGEVGSSLYSAACSVSSFRVSGRHLLRACPKVFRPDCTLQPSELLLGRKTHCGSHPRAHSLAVFSVFTVLCSHDHCVILEHSHHPEKQACADSWSLPKPSTPPPSPGNFLSPRIHSPILGVSCKWNPATCGLFCLVSCSEHHAFNVHPCCLCCLKSIKNTNRWALGLLVKMPAGTPASCIGVPGFKSWLHHDSRFLLTCIRGSSR